MISKDCAYPTTRHPIRLFEQLEAPVRITSEAGTTESDPEITRGVFGEGSRKGAFRIIVLLGEVMKCFGGSLPSGQSVYRVGNRCDPDVAARVFIESEYIVRRQSVSGFVDCLRPRVSELSDVTYFRKTVEPGTSGHPPFSHAILERDLIPTPTKIDDVLRNVRPNGGEAFTIELIDGPPYVKAAANNTQLAFPVFEDGCDSAAAKAICFAESGKSGARDFYSAAASGSQPEIAVEILVQRPYARIVKALS